MALKIRIRITRLSILLLAMALAISCDTSVSSGPPTIDEYKLGEQWIWKWQRSSEGEVRAQGEDIHEIIEINGELAISYGYDTVKLSVILQPEESETPFRDWPLFVGKKWTYESEWTNEGGYKGKTSQDVEVLSFEELQTEAGRFSAFQIEYKGTIENYTTGGKGNVNDIWWYCPELKTYIKHIQDDGFGLYTSELIHYSEGE